MATNARLGAVIFATDHKRLAGFYAAMTGLPVQVANDTIVVLSSDVFELVIHKLSGEPVGSALTPRLDCYIKPFFPVTSLAAARGKAVTFGGRVEPAEKEWDARGFRASEAIDPEGNVIQFREDAP